MADTAATLSVLSYPMGADNTQRNDVIRGRISLSAGRYPGPTGIALDWSGLEAIKSIPLGGSTPSTTGGPVPIDIDIKSVRNPPSGVVYQCDISSTAGVGNLHIYISNNGVSSNSGPLIEIGGTLPGWVINDTIQFTAYFKRN